MPSNPQKRQDHKRGVDFQLFNDGASSPRSQGVTLCDDSGAPITAQPVTASLLPLPTGAATAANQQTDALTDAQLRASPVPVSQMQILDSNNTKAITSADASPGNPWVGAATQTRSAGTVGVMLNAIATSALGGTYTFEFSEDGVNWPISIPITVADFSTIRYRQLLNVGEYFRAKFEPASPLGQEKVFLTTQLSRQSDPVFVVPSGHVFEETDAAFGAYWAFPKMFDEAGKSHSVRCNPTGQQINADFLVEVAKGNVPGHSLVDVVGRNPDIDSANAETVWLAGGTFTPPPAAGTVSITSTSGNDDAAGIGARTLTINGINASYGEVSETVSMTGQTPVVTSNSFIAVNNAFVATAGSAGSNAGTITGVIGSDTMFGISPNFNNTALGFYTVPAGKTAFLYDYDVSQSNQSASALYAYLCLRIGETGLIRRRKHFGGHSQGSGVSGSFNGTTQLPEKSFLRWDADVTANNNPVNCMTTILLVDD